MRRQVSTPSSLLGEGEKSAGVGGRGGGGFLRLLQKGVEPSIASSCTPYPIQHSGTFFSPHTPNPSRCKDSETSLLNHEFEKMSRSVGQLLASPLPPMFPKSAFDPPVSCRRELVSHRGKQIKGRFREHGRKGASKQLSYTPRYLLELMVEKAGLAVFALRGIWGVGREESARKLDGVGCAGGGN